MGSITLALVGWVELAKPNAIYANFADVGFRPSTQPTSWATSWAGLRDFMN